jgi:hypothetical protein
MNSFDLFGNPTGKNLTSRKDRGEELDYSQDVEPLGDEITDGTTPHRPLWGIGIALALALTVIFIK